jgi:hypothetical protein
LRARVLLLEEGSYRFGCEIDVPNADDVWRRLEASPGAAGRALRSGDIVYIQDLYLELNGDGGWRALPPSELTQSLYSLIAAGGRVYPGSD